jgi:hypothetical protein
MPKLVVMGAMLKCSMGQAPATLVVPQSSGNNMGKMAATVKDCKPANIPATFVMCKSPSSPGWMPQKPLGKCQPQLQQWMPGALKTEFKNGAALTADSKCVCALGGMVEITDPGSTIDVM